MATLDMHCEEA